MNLTEFRKEYPDYNDLSDLVLADSLYESNYQDLDKNQFYKTLFPNLAKKIDIANEKKLSPEINGIISPDDDLNNQNLLQNTSYRPTVGMIAERSGVSINDPATSRARFGASLGINPDQKALAIKNSLSKLFKQDIDVRTGSNTGELEYYNPKTKKYALVDPPGKDLGDFADVGGDLMVILPDLVTTILTGGAAKAIGGGAVIAGIGEYARLKLGQAAYDINKFNPDGSKVTETQLLKEAGKTAAISATFGFGGLAVVNAAKGVNNIIKGRIAPDDLVDFVKTKTNAEDLSRELNDQLAKAKIDSRLRFKTSQALNDPDLMAVQQKMETSPRLGYVQDFSEATTKEMNALNDYFSLLRSEFDPKGLLKNQNQYDVDGLIKEVITKRNTPQIQKLIKEQELSEDLLTKTINELPDGNKIETGINVRSAVEDFAKVWDDNANKALVKLDEAAGGVKIKSDIFGKAIKEMDDKQLDTIFKLSDPSIAKSLRGDEILDGSAIVDVSTLRNSMSYLKRQIRKGEKGLQSEDIDVGILKNIVGKINKQIVRDAPPKFVTAFDTYNDVYSKGKSRLNDTIVANVMKTKNGRLVVGEEEVFGLTFKKGFNSKRVAEDIHEVIKDSPDAMLSYKSSINDFYKSKVIVNDKVNIKKHNEFIENHKDKLKIFFNQKEYNQITKIGGLQNTINNIEKTRVDLIKNLSKSFEGKLDNATSGELFEKIYKPNKIGEIKELKKILSKDPEIFQAFKNNVLKDLSDSVTVKHGTIGIDVLSPERLKDYVYGGAGEKGNQFALKEIFGEPFMKNLKLLNDNLQITARKAPAKLAEEGVYGNIITDFIRVKVGQFSQAGRLLTASKRIYHKTSNHIMRNAILNPENLADLMKLKKLSPKSIKASYILGKLNGLLYLDPTQDGER